MSLPLKLINRLKNFYPDDHEYILKGFEGKKKGSFRINTLKSSTEKVLAEFSDKNIEISLYTGFSSAVSQKYWVYTFDRKFEYAIKGTDAFYQGGIYLQSLASMMPVFVMNPQESTNILDVCAAPGGKTTQIAMHTSNTAKITALEKNAMRHTKLKYNISLQGAEKNITTYKIDAIKFLKGTTSIRLAENFDMILLDAPCSAEGRISLEREKSYGFWSMQNVLDKASLQFDLLSASVSKLNSGGSLVYSTCTLAPEENEGVVSRILEAFPEISLAKVPEIFSQEENSSLSYVKKGLSLYDTPEQKISEKTLKILPSEYTEGFFVAKFVKK